MYLQIAVTRQTALFFNRGNTSEFPYDNPFLEGSKFHPYKINRRSCKLIPLPARATRAGIQSCPVRDLRLTLDFYILTHWCYISILAMTALIIA